MTETEREDYLALFDTDTVGTLIGFAVMGGLFGEGIDLVGDRLVGVAVVGVGLPQICLERELIRDYFAAREADGFAYAYMFPGMNRVLQAAGRVIRTPEDRGAVLLIDQRFGHRRYRRLFPAWWHPVQQVRRSEEIEEAVKAFWNLKN
jgi:DNA excision repair protein ERCC-2